MAIPESIPMFVSGIDTCCIEACKFRSQKIGMAPKAAL